MNYTKKKMTEVADNPRGFWGKKMLNKMNDRHKGLIKWGLSGIDIEKYRDILDIGCGSGNSLSMMYHKNKKAHFFGVDYSKDSVKMAKKTIKTPSLTGICRSSTAMYATCRTKTILST